MTPSPTSRRATCRVAVRGGERVSPISVERDLLSTIVAGILDDPVVTVGGLVDRAAQHGFGLLMIVLSLPLIIPVLPPGVALVVGLLYIVLAAQMLLGLERPWLPGGVRRYRLSPRAKLLLRQRGIPFLRRVERFTRPRQLWIPDVILTRIVAVAVLVLGIVLFSPLPFFHPVPAVTVMILGFGLINRDALFVGCGLVVSVGAVAVAVFGAEEFTALLWWINGRIR